jgi:hypothetical protein
MNSKNQQKVIKRNNAVYKVRKHNYDNFSYHDEQHDICMYCDISVRVDCRQQHNSTNKHRLHMAKYFKKEVYECKDCDYKTVSIQTFARHLLIHAHAPIKPYDVNYVNPLTHNRKKTLQASPFESVKNAPIPKERTTGTVASLVVEI